MSLKEVIAEFKEQDVFFKGIYISKLSSEVAHNHQDHLMGMGYKDIKIICSEYYERIMKAWEEYKEKGIITLDEYFNQQIDYFEGRGYTELPKVLRAFFEQNKEGDNKPKGNDN